MGDSFSSNLDQVPGRHFAHLHVIRSDKMGRQVGEVAIKEKIGRSHIAQLIEISEARLAGRDHQNINSATQEGANLLPLDVWILFGGGKNQCSLACPEDYTQRLGELGEE